MQLRKILTQHRGVSPVIAVILMVAITVILSAVIGTFVLDIGSSLSESPPRASFDVEVNDQYDYDAHGGSYDRYTKLQIVNLTMTAGEEISGDNVRVMFEGERVFKGIPSDEGPSTGWDSPNNWETPVPATYGIDTLTAGTTIRLIAMAGPVYDTIGGSWENGDLIWATNQGPGEILYDGTGYEGMKFDQGGTLRIVWESTEGNSQILYETEIPAA